MDTPAIWPRRWCITAIRAGRAMKLFRNLVGLPACDRYDIDRDGGDHVAFTFNNLQVAAVHRLFRRPRFSGCRLVVEPAKRPNPDDPPLEPAGDDEVEFIANYCGRYPFELCGYTGTAKGCITSIIWI
jgi:hypothetical protein